MSDSKTCKSCGPDKECASQQDQGMGAQDQAIHEALGLIQNKLLVMSGKGGVGKSSVSTNLAIALSEKGAKVGIMDVDLHGPDVPRMLGLKGLLDISPDQRMIPKSYSDHLKVVSIESLAQDVDQAVIWRGPLKMQIIRQFISDVHWGPLDYLVIDSPPGTGDEPLSVAQTVPGAKAVIVTTPQEISLADVRKSISFCRTVNMPILGIIENMSGFVCPHCGKTTELFGVGGGEKTAEAMNIPFLGRIPFDADVVKSADAGESYLKKYPDSGVTQAYNEIAEKVMREAQTAGSGVQSTPKGGASQEKAKDGIRKIAIPVAEGKLTAHFGHAAQFVLMHLQDGEVKDKELLTPPPHEPGVLPKWLGEMGVDVIIAGGMGQKALSLFEQNGIHVCTGAPSLPPEELVNRFLSGTLEAGENVCDH
jgi:Mrp family chromosome partitioning ATPase/predicted Fe-Mo cluster-binding NifX family protein